MSLYMQSCIHWIYRSITKIPAKNVPKMLCLHQLKRINIRCLRSVLERRLTSINQTEDVVQKYMDFKKGLRNQKIQYKDGPTCLQFECRLCNVRQGANKLKAAFVNKRTGIFLCPTCDVKQSLSDALSIYEGAKQPLSIKDDIEYKFRSTNIEPVTQNICDIIGIKDLKASDLEMLGAKYDSKTNCIHFPLRNAAQMIVGEKILRINDKSEDTLPPTNCSGLLIYQSRPMVKTKALLVTNLLDFLVLTTQRPDNYCVVCLPHGLKSLPQECLPVLEPFSEVIFWFDYDYTGWDTARLFANKMNENRCLLIRSTDTEPAPHKAYEKGLNLRQIIQRALPVQHKSLTTFNALRSDILSELQNIEKVNGVKWKRFPILNKLLKGHRKGELTIITGPTGSGKTTFMSEYSLDLALQGVPTLWGSFEIRNSRLASTLLRQFVGYSLEEKLHEFDYWANQFEKYPLYFMTFHGQQPLKIVMEAIEHAQYVYDINHVIIDNLQFMMGVSSSYRIDKFWEQDAIIASFRAFATKYNVHVTLVMHPRKERDADELTTSSVFGTAKATQEADNVLIIQDKRLTSVRGKKYLQIVKNRYSGDLGIMPLEFDKESLSYAKPKKEKSDVT